MQQLRRLIAISLLLTLLAHAPAKAETNWVEFQAGGHSVRALIAVPPAPGPHAAVLYNHGTAVRDMGYDGAANRGYDTKGYVEALAAAGYVGLAPIRDHLASASYEDAVSGGVETVKAAIDYLRGRDDVDGDRIAAVGFSEGGLVTLWSAIEGAELKAVVLMSPATMRDAGDRQLKAAARKPLLKRLAMPVMLTVGADDNRSIRKVTARRLIPNMEAMGMPFIHKSDYPGDHKWFWKVRADHFGDIRVFLAEHLK